VGSVRRHELWRRVRKAHGRLASKTRLALRSEGLSMAVRRVDPSTRAYCDDASTRYQEASGRLMRLRASLAVLDSRLTDIGGFLPEDKHGLGHRHIVQVDDAGGAQ